MLGHSLILYETSLSLARPCLLVGRRVLFARRRKCVPHHGGPPLRKTFSPFSLRPRNKKKKRVREGVFHRVGGPPTPSIYFGLFVRAICLRLLGGRLHSYLQRGSLFFSF